jgi:hypothetical protein
MSKIVRSNIDSSREKEEIRLMRICGEFQEVNFGHMSHGYIPREVIRGLHTLLAER